MTTLTQYFKENAANNIIDFALRVSLNADGYYEFYIHPQYQSGDTKSYVIGKSFSWDTSDLVKPKEH